MSDNQVSLRYLQISIPLERIMNYLWFLRRHTNVSSFKDAIELIQIGELTFAEKDCVSLLITVWRAWMDGEIEPPVDLELLYANSGSSDATTNVTGKEVRT